MNRVGIYIVIDKELKDRFDKICRNNFLIRGQIINKLIKDFVENEENKRDEKQL